MQNAANQVVTIDGKRVLYLREKMIELDRCPVLYDKPFTAQSLQEDFEAASGKWFADDDHWLTGEIREDAGGMLYSRASYDCDMIFEFDAETVGGCSNDLNFVWKTCGWDAEKHDAGRGYIGGLGGWWLNKAGIEKYPECIPFAATPLYPLEAGKPYHIIAGGIDGHCFVFANGELLLEMIDSAPETLADCGRFGLGTYASCIRYRNLKVYRAQASGCALKYL